MSRNDTKVSIPYSPFFKKKKPLQRSGEGLPKCQRRPLVNKGERRVIYIDTPNLRSTLQLKVTLAQALRNLSVLSILGALLRNFSPRYCLSGWDVGAFRFRDTRPKRKRSKQPAASLSEARQCSTSISSDLGYGHV